jgi:cytochrome P450
MADSGAADVGQTAHLSGRPVADGRPFDPMDREAAGDPYPWLRLAQRDCPVFYIERYELWCVTRHRDILEVLRDTETYSSRKVIDFSNITPDFLDAFPDGRPDRVLVTMDPPAHTRLRKLAQKAFTPKMIAAREPEIRRLANALIDGFVEDGRCDFVGQYADHLPVQAITQLVGAPLDQTPTFFEWANDRITMLQGAPHLGEGHRAELMERARRFNGWLQAFVEERRSRPRDDLASALVHARGDNGEPALTTAEVVAMIGTILSAGTSTTAHFLPVAVRELLRHGDQWSRLQADRSLVPGAVEECLRLRTSVRGVVRTTTRRVQISGVTIPAEADLYLHFGAAQRDPEVFAEPETFDITRHDVKRHFAFGRWTHMCLGAPLARQEARVTIECLLDRLPELRLAPDQREDWIPNFLAPRLSSLLLEWNR